jgi:hypothetical protein
MGGRRLASFGVAVAALLVGVAPPVAGEVGAYAPGRLVAGVGSVVDINAYNVVLGEKDGKAVVAKPGAALRTFSGSPVAINDLGDVLVRQGTSGAIVAPDGTREVLPRGPFPTVTPTAFNNRGQVVGIAPGSLAVRWSSPTAAPSVLRGRPPGVTGGQYTAAAISDAGWVVGDVKEDVNDSEVLHHIVYWDAAGAYTELEEGQLLDVDGRGIAVGWVTVGDSEEGVWPRDPRPVMVDLNAPATRWHGPSYHYARSIAGGKALLSSYCWNFEGYPSCEGFGVGGTVWDGANLADLDASARETGEDSYGGAHWPVAIGESGNAVAQGNTFDGVVLFRPTPIRLFPTATAVEKGKAVTGTRAEFLAARGPLGYALTSTTSGTRTATWNATFRGIPNATPTMALEFVGRATRSCAQKLEIFNFTTSKWGPLHRRTMGTADGRPVQNVGGTVAHYVGGSSGNGDVKIRSTCTASANFTQTTDVLALHVH